MTSSVFEKLVLPIEQMIQSLHNNKYPKSIIEGNSYAEKISYLHNYINEEDEKFLKNIKHHIMISDGHCEVAILLCELKERIRYQCEYVYGFF